MSVMNETWVDIAKHHDQSRNQLLYDFLLKFQHCGTVKRLQKKDIIFREGHKGEHLYLLLKGVVRLYRTLPNGQERTLWFVRSKELYGNIPFFDGGEHTVTAEVFEPGVNFMISYEKLKEIGRQLPQLFMLLGEDITFKLRLFTRAVDENNDKAAHRILKYLRLMCERFGVETDRGMELRIHFTHEELARFSGTTRVTVTKFISDLVRDGVISIKPKPWIILDYNTMKQMEIAYRNGCCGGL